MGSVQGRLGDGPGPEPWRLGHAPVFVARFLSIARTACLAPLAFPGRFGVSAVFLGGGKKQDSSSCAAALAREERHAEAQNAAPQLAQCAGRAQTTRRSAASLEAGRGKKREIKRARRAWGRLTGPSAIRPGRRTSAPRSDLPVASPPRRPKWPEDVFPRPPGQALKRFVHKPLCYNPLAARGRVFKPRGQTGEPSPAAAPRGWRRLGGARPRVRRTGPRRGLKKDGRGIPPNSAPGARSRVKHKSGACA